ncbi:MAG: hypothetical protein U0166_26600 [Acidobacteriota bacterium]
MNHHILVFEDEIDTRFLMIEELSQDFVVLDAASGADFETLAQHGEPVAVVTDMHMGAGRNGADVLELTRRLWPCAARVVVSGSEGARDLLAVGVADVFVRKPWTWGGLLPSVRSAIRAAAEERETAGNAV